MAELTTNRIAYLYPNDEQELDRLDMQHHMFKLINEGRLFFAPVKNPQRILDIGTGSGIWPMEMGMLPPLPSFDVLERTPFLTNPLSIHLPTSRNRRHRPLTRPADRSTRKRPFPRRRCHRRRLVMGT